MESALVYGVNLAGWLVLEPWVTPSLFDSTGAFDEAGLKLALGEEEFAKTIEAHRKLFITERDFKQIAARGYNAVRLPVPWNAASRGAGAYGSTNCLDYIDAAFEWAKAAHLEILLDLVVDAEAQARPADFNDYVGTKSRFRPLVIGALAQMAARYAPHEAFLGIEVLNEPPIQRRRGLVLTPGVPVHVLRNFYRDCYEAVRAAAGPNPVLVFPAGDRPDAWNFFLAQPRYTNVWLDLHLYHYGTPFEAAGPQAMRSLVERSVTQIKKAKKSGLPIVVGEWSSALPVGAATLTPEGLAAMERIYAAAQIEAFRQTSGWFFQTWKTEAKLSAWDARVALSSFERGMFD